MPTFTTTRNYAANTVLTEAQLDAAFDSVETFLNTTGLDDDNIQTGGVGEDSLATNSVSTIKIQNDAITTAKLDDDAVTRAKIADGSLGGNPTSVSTTYTALTSDDVIYANATSAAFTITLFTAVGNDGKLLYIQKTDTSTNAVTIDGDGSETVEGTATITLNTTGESVLLQSDNANWLVIERGKKFQNQVSKTTTYTALTSDEVIYADATSAAFTITLFTAVGQRGKILRIQKTDATFNAVTIDGASSETVGGAATTTLNTQNEALMIISDNTNWVILNRTIPSVYVSYTPTGNFTTNTTYTGRWRRLGDVLEVIAKISFGGSPNDTNATIIIPTGLVIDEAKLLTSSNFQWLGGGELDDNNGNHYPAHVFYDNTTEVQIRYWEVNGAVTISTAITDPGGPITIAINDYIQCNFRVPIVGWNG